MGWKRPYISSQRAAAAATMSFPKPAAKQRRLASILYANEGQMTLCPRDLATFLPDSLSKNELYAATYESVSAPLRKFARSAGLTQISMPIGIKMQRHVSYSASAYLRRRDERFRRPSHPYIARNLLWSYNPVTVGNLCTLGYLNSCSISSAPSPRLMLDIYLRRKTCAR